MANVLNSYAKTIIDQDPRIASLVNAYSGLGKGQVSDEVFTSAIKHPHSLLVHETLYGYVEYIRTYRDMFDIYHTIEGQMVSMNKRIVSLQDKSDRSDEKSRSTISPQIKQLQASYLALSELKVQLSMNLKIIMTSFDELREYSDVINEEWKKFRTETCQKIFEELKSHNVTLHEEEKKELFSDVGWGELMELVKRLEIKIPRSIDLENPDYNTYFEVKRRLAIKRATHLQGDVANIDFESSKELIDEIYRFSFKADQALTYCLEQYVGIFSSAKKACEDILAQANNIVKHGVYQSADVRSKDQ